MVPHRHKPSYKIWMTRSEKRGHGGQLRSILRRARGTRKNGQKNKEPRTLVMPGFFSKPLLGITASSACDELDRQGRANPFPEA